MKCGLLKIFKTILFNNIFILLGSVMKQFRILIIQLLGKEINIIPIPIPIPHHELNEDLK